MKDGIFDKQTWIFRPEKNGRIVGKSCLSSCKYKNNIIYIYICVCVWIYLYIYIYDACVCVCVNVCTHIINTINVLCTHIFAGASRSQPRSVTPLFLRSSCWARGLEEVKEVQKQSQTHLSRVATSDSKPRNLSSIYTAGHIAHGSKIVS